MNAPVIFLDWDTTFFGKRIGRVLTHNMSEEDACEIDGWSVINNIDCVYYLADGLLPSSSYAAENHNFHMVDQRVTFHIELDQFTPRNLEIEHIRKAKEEDIPHLRQMIRENHQISRFFADDHFEREKCARLYEVWIERDFSTKDYLLWIWVNNEIPVAYTSVHINTVDKTAEIGLVGIHKDFRGRNLGRDLQLWVLNNLKELKVNSVEVATQGRNISAQNLYYKCGYKLKSINLWYHKWYT